MIYSVFEATARQYTMTDYSSVSSPA